jgi:hypothetical protein
MWGLSLWELFGRRAARERRLELYLRRGGRIGRGIKPSRGASPGAWGSRYKLGAGREAVEAEGGVLDEHFDA